MHSDDCFAPVMYLELLDFKLEPRICTDYNDGWKQEMKSRIAFPDECTQLEFQDSIPNTKFNFEHDKYDSVDPKIIVVCNEPFVSVSIASATTGSSLANETLANLGIFKTELSRFKLSFSNIVLMTVYIRDMNQFSEFNKVYALYFGVNPSPRVTVELNIASTIKMELLAYRDDKKVGFTKESLHVQGISHWAPANIGYFDFNQAIQPGLSLC